MPIPIVAVVTPTQLAGRARPFNVQRLALTLPPRCQAWLSLKFQSKRAHTHTHKHTPETANR